MTAERASFTINTIAVGTILVSAVFGNVPLFARSIEGPQWAVAPLHAAAASPRPAAGVANPSQEAELIPAIYAWDPDIRFVFYHHVSKWM